MEAFTPLTATIGGVLIGIAAGMLWLLNGRVAGISGIAGGLVPTGFADAGWRIAFLVGLPVGAAAGLAWGPALFSEMDATLPSVELSPLMLVVAGLIVGIGTRIGRGCTSGHGVCGLARFSRRSAVGVAVFMATAALTVYVARHVV